MKNLLVELEDRGILKSSNIKKALNAIDRKDFLTDDSKSYFEINAPISIGYGQTNSQPLTVVFMLELLDVKEGNKILDVGSGSGWTTALLAFLAGKKSEVIGVERVKELVEFGQKNLQKYNFSHAKIIEAQKGKFGIPQKKFDRILVSAAYHEIPKDLLDQLEINGIMVVPVASSIFKVEKISEKEIRKEEFVGFTFVPLIK
jgi:protein-L-isoaspartate(D-aspartate) O-methyltransferase